MTKRQDKKAAAKEFQDAKRAIDQAQQRGVDPDSEEGLRVQEAAWTAREKAPWWVQKW